MQLADQGSSGILWNDCQNKTGLNGAEFLLISLSIIFQAAVYNLWQWWSLQRCCCECGNSNAPAVRAYCGHTAPAECCWRMQGARRGPTVVRLLLQSAAGTGFRVYAGGTPLVVADPSCETAGVFMELGAAVVRELAKLQALPRNAVRCRSSLPPLSRPAPGSHHLIACSCRPTTHLPSPNPATRLSLPCPPAPRLPRHCCTLDSITYSHYCTKHPSGAGSPLIPQSSHATPYTAVTEGHTANKCCRAPLGATYHVGADLPHVLLAWGQNRLYPAPRYVIRSCWKDRNKWCCPVGCPSAGAYPSGNGQACSCPAAGLTKPRTRLL